MNHLKPHTAPTDSNTIGTEQRTSTLAPRPGPLHGGAMLTLHTHQAQQLVRGRARSPSKSTIVGLLGFASSLAPIWHGARLEDPFAHWWLLKVEVALANASASLHALRAEVDQRLSVTSALQADTAVSTKPSRTQLNFNNPYAFEGARLLVAFDEMVRATLSAQRLAAVSRRDAERHLLLSGRRVRRAFQSAAGYTFTGVTWLDFDVLSDAYHQAQIAMGPVPQKVVDRTHQASHAPKPSSHSMPSLSAALALTPLDDTTHQKPVSTRDATEPDFDDDCH